MAQTLLLPPATHQSFDRHWMQWIRTRRAAIRASGSSDYNVPVSAVFEAQLQAIAQTTGMTPQQRGTAGWLMELEFRSLTADLPAGMETRVPLPDVR